MCLSFECCSNYRTTIGIAGHSVLLHIATHNFPQEIPKGMPGQAHKAMLNQHS